ncbi:tyrosine-type recombinase/integrase [Gelidibacter japonicus]|uniref:tyrosine-type recombinase/integrase n=1 Tax=Gelidibacter japonicus TaxID=1962232 RepID=UPI003A93EB31
MSIKLREKKLAKGAIKFYLDIYINGERSYEFLDIKIEPNDSKSVKSEKRNIANLIRSNRELEYLTSNTNYIPKHLRNINFFDFAETFQKEYKKKDIRMIDASILQFKAFVENPKLKLSEINPTMMRGFMDYLNNDAGLNGETPHNYFTRFKKILKNAEQKGLINVLPTKDIKFRRKVQRNELRKQILTSDELKVLAQTKCGNEELRNAFLFACFTGLGYAEIKQLTWGNIVNNRLVTRREKTNQKVDVKIKDSILALLGKRGKKEDGIFNMRNENGKLISDNGVNKCLKNWVGRAKIDKHITFYCARHTYATQLLLYGANLKTVADALGHSNTQHTIKYLNYIDSLADDAVDNLPELDF